MSSSASPVQLGPTYGAELLATFVSVALWGTTCMQTVVYFIQYPRDQSSLKTLVAWLWLADTVHEILIVKGVYNSQINGFCNFERISTVVPEFLWQILLTSLVAISAQTFFTYRIWKFSNRSWIYWAILVPVCLFEFVGAIAFITLGTITPTAAEIVSPAPSGLFTAVQAVGAAADLTIAAGLIHLLVQSRERAFKESRSVLQKLLLLTINTGLWTALFAVFTFVSILAFKQTLIYAALYFPICPLYCNTVLANLNARDLLKPRSLLTDSGLSGSFRLDPVFVSQPVRLRPVVQAGANKQALPGTEEQAPLGTRMSKIEIESP